MGSFGQHRRVKTLAAEARQVFGFLRVDNKHLDEPRTQMYRAHFCAGCHAMVEFGGRLSSLLTNYDVTFWLWVATALEEHSGRKVPPELRACTAVPLRKVWVHPLRPEIRQAMASINLALMASKVEDNRRDGDHRLLVFAFRPLLRPAQKALQALAQLGFPAERIEQLAELQSTAENNAELGLEDFARPTRELMGEIFAFLGPLTQQPRFSEPLRNLGERLGRLLYLLDALSDIDKDRKKGAFNAFLKVQGYPLAYARVAPIMRAAVTDLEEALKALPMGQTEPMATGMISHLRGLVGKELKRWKSQKATSAGWGGLRHMRLAGFFQPVKPADCDCGGCDGCGDGCSGCDCSGCGSCGDGCSGCDCCNCSNCGSCNCDICSGCGGGGGDNSCSSSKIECCCDTSSCACDSIECCSSDDNVTCCCCSSDSKRKKGPQYNVTPEPAPVDTKGNWGEPGSQEPVEDKGHRRDHKGRRVDAEGRLIDEQGRHINQLGQLIDDSGNIIGPG